MDRTSAAAFYSAEARPLAMVLGTNEIASAVAVRLTADGYSVAMIHDPFPPVIRRAMAFHDALYGDPAQIEGIVGARAETAFEFCTVLTMPHHVAVTSLHLTDLLAIRSPAILVDARMQKHRTTPDYRGLARVTVGLGPQFSVGLNCDTAVETRPAKNGTVVGAGGTDNADGVARALGGIGRERFVYTEREGIWHTPVDIGMRVFKGFVLGYLDGLAVSAPIDGVLRGIARDATRMPSGVKLLEIDPRGRQASWTGTDERGRAIAQATLEAIRLAESRRRAIGVTPSSLVN